MIEIINFFLGKHQSILPSTTPDWGGVSG